MISDVYLKKNSEYLRKNESWHVEDSPWKALQIIKLIQRNSISPKTIVEIGCGGGEILNQLYQKLPSDDTIFEGYDIAPDAYELSKQRIKERLNFFQEDLLQKTNVYYDVLLMIDVFEHVENYYDFIVRSSAIAQYKIYHIPLEISVSTVLRNKLIDAKNNVGHLHFFTKDVVLSILKDTGQEILDFFYTSAAIEQNNRKLRTKLLNIPRKLLFKLNPDFIVRLFGGYSLIVLTR